MERTLLPIGIDNFGELITHQDSSERGYLFVDKTLLIKDFIDANDKVGLITRPRRFGKTINMSMLQHFFAAEVSGNATQGLFEGLAISQHPKVMAEQGQWPVIFLSLKDVKGGTFEAFLGSIREVLLDLFYQHRQLLKQNIGEPFEKRFTTYLSGEANIDQCKNALKWLSQLFYDATKKPVYLLIDEYDTPLHQSYIHDYYEEGKEFMTAFLGSALKGNDYLKKALVTGILKVAKASLFSGLNNFEVYSVLDSTRYGQYFGFTEAETNNLLDRAKLPQQAHQLKEMYNGYQIGDYTLYNPWSIVSFAKNAQLEGPEKALKPYWVNTASDSILRGLLRENLPTLEPKLTQLFQGIPVEEAINTDIVFDKELWVGEMEFWSIMLLSGYLKVTASHISVTGRAQYKLAFPNQEISQAIQNLLLDLLAGNQANAYDNAIGELVIGDVDKFITFLKTSLAHITSLHDLRKAQEREADNPPERFYKGLLLGMAASLHRHFIVTSEGEGQAGRYDISIVARDPKKYFRGIVLELKAASSEKDLEKLAEAALTQIKTKGYDAPLRQQGATEIVRLGIAFYKKEVEVALG